ncbi:hypothetical protein N1031_05225 [Herbiconiux moechotypicola]|nr:hypothetical protein [Herbiconiux moechotypicola]MCS5729156.1 hypothetical protein [Herbiconiux moechotypicola]
MPRRYRPPRPPVTARPAFTPSLTPPRTALRPTRLLAGVAHFATRAAILAVYNATRRLAWRNRRVRAWTGRDARGEQARGMSGPGEGG